MDSNLATKWSREDRDLLIELRTEMGGVRTDIKDVKDSVEKNSGDHETRIRSLEAQSNRWVGKESLVGGAIGIMASLAAAILKSHGG